VSFLSDSERECDGDSDRDCDDDGKGDCAEMVTAAERGDTERVTDMGRPVRERVRMTGRMIVITKYVYIKNTTVYVPSSELGLPQPSLFSKRVYPLPTGTKGGGAHSSAGEGLGESQFRRLEKKPSTLPTL
jgi:hypothetical protein